MAVQVGQPAPAFTSEALKGMEFTKISLAEYKGKWLVLFFYPLDFTFVCPTEITAFSDAYDEFTKRKADILGCSVDSKHSHKAWVKDGLGQIRFPLLSDLTHKVSEDYGVLDTNTGHSQRGTFIIDPDGLLRWMVVHDEDVGRSIEETLRVLDALQTGGKCSVNWRKGDALLKG